MTDWKQRTIDTYNNSARELAAYFKGIGSRVDDIEQVLSLAPERVNPTVIEIGCGDGRDAKEIVGRTKNYTGFDISSGLIAIAKEQVPKGRFVVADALTFAYPAGCDVVFAFASLLHLSRDELNFVIQRVHGALKLNGVFFISLKYRPEYTSEVKKDSYGERLFYFYNPDIITEMTADLFDVVASDNSFVTGADTKWFDMILVKK